MEVNSINRFYPHFAGPLQMLSPKPNEMLNFPPVPCLKHFYAQFLTSPLSQTLLCSISHQSPVSSTFMLNFSPVPLSQALLCSVLNVLCKPPCWLNLASSRNHALITFQCVVTVGSLLGCELWFEILTNFWCIMDYFLTCGS
ncbi:hypothetical protein BsWGS_08413 [Bradybaena similaris]